MGRDQWSGDRPNLEVIHKNLGRPLAAIKVHHQAIDVSIFEAGKSRPFLIAEAKRHKRQIHAGIAGSTIALVQDVGGVPAVMVSTSGFSHAASNHLSSEGIAHFTITLKEAQGLRWIPMIEAKFALDREFREVSGHLMEALRNGDPAPFLDSDLPYEEWLAVLHFGVSRFPEAAGGILRVLAREHFDDGVRFNSVQLLDDAGQLKSADINGSNATLKILSFCAKS